MSEQNKRFQRILTLFQTSQCSLCRRFYTNEPFLCPSGKLQSNCASFDQFIEVIGWSSKEKELEKYSLRIVEMMQEVEYKGIMAKCQHSNCGSLNPNPQKPFCWKCGKSLDCPRHPNILIYNIHENYWKCSDASHPQIFYEIIESTQTVTLCPECSQDSLSEEEPTLYYDAELFLLKCNICNRYFTYDKGILKEVKFKKEKY